MGQIVSSISHVLPSRVSKVTIENDTISALAQAKSRPLSVETSRSPSRHPGLIYGTAWKETETDNFVFEALSAGYRAIDTAAQPRHYREDLVGDGLRKAVAAGLISRQSVVIQTKFSHLGLQDLTSMPFNEHDSIRDQVRASIASSLENLRVGSIDESYLDTVLLHGILPTGKQTLEAWQALEEFVPHKVRKLGLSNVTLAQVKTLHRLVTIKPAVVQNRFYATTQYDGGLREFCSAHGIDYQAYWVLKKNQDLLQQPPILGLSQSAAMSAPMALFLFIQHLHDGISILDGTTRRYQMDVNISELNKGQIWIAQACNNHVWHELQYQFQSILEKD